MKNLTSKKSNVKNIIVASVLSAAALFSVNASAAQTVSLEEAISQFIINQSQQMVAELNTQIIQSITVEVDKISTRFVSSNEVNVLALSEKIEFSSTQENNTQINQVEE